MKYKINILIQIDPIQFETINLIAIKYPDYQVVLKDLIVFVE